MAGAAFYGTGFASPKKRRCVSPNIKMFKLVHYSYCYLAKVTGEEGVPNFTEDEIKDGFEILWVSPEKALNILKSDITEIPVARLYILPREKYFLEKFIKKTP